MKEKVLKILLEADDFVSGQKLCEELQVSRTAVWKAIRRLQEDGYRIEAVTNKGYRLTHSSEADVLGQVELERALEPLSWAGHPVIFKAQTGSTNEDIFALSEQEYPQGTLVAAAAQTRGKGRRGRTWISPENGNIYMSLLLKPGNDLQPVQAPMTTLVAALAVYNALLELDLPETLRIGIKWPNDVVVSKEGGEFKKICGILTEMRMEEMEIRDVVVGIGLNINQTQIPEEVISTATSLKIAADRTICRTELTAALWRHFEEDYEAFLSAGDLSPLRETYEGALVNRNREVRVLDPAGEYSGTAKGITEAGELIVIRNEDGKEMHIGAGEVSVRGVMGYC